NRLTREQLYWAEVEQWAVERARLVLVRNDETSQAVRRHYRGREVATLDPRAPLDAPRNREQLLARLGLAGTRYVAFLGRDMSERDVLALLSSVNDPAFALTDRGVWAKTPRSRAAALSQSPASGEVLAALLKGAELVVALDKNDPRAEEARALGCRIHGGSTNVPECDLRRIDAVFDGRAGAPSISARVAPEAELTHAIQ
ncbi:MAG TPA: hypothetical protein VFF73_25565, partial [Planctomycetota bacterium]|nr:hypothetical protein [Planctomycetota bacterium]